MTVGADVAVDVEIVEQHELARQLVMIGRCGFVEQAQGRVAVAFADFAEYLIVSPVLFHDVNDVLNRRMLFGTRDNHAVGRQ